MVTLVLVLAVEVVMEELGKTWDDVIVGLTMGGDTEGGDILEELTVGEGILEILTECDTLYRLLQYRLPTPK